MSRTATGSVYGSHGKWFAKLTIAPRVRRTFMLPSCHTEEAARARLEVLIELAAKLRRKGHPRLAEELLSDARPSRGRGSPTPSAPSTRHY